MQGAIRKRDIIAHPVITIECFGWEVFVRSLVARRRRTFLSVVGRNVFGPVVAAELPEFLARGRRLELRAMLLYRSLAQRFVGVRRVHQLFLDLARQEEYHAELLELCHASSGGQRWTECFDPWREVVAHLEDRMRGFERRVEQLVGVAGALRFILDVESSEINDVFTAIVNASRSGFVRSVKAFRSAEQEHMELICRTLPALAPELADACQALRQKHQ